MSSWADDPLGAGLRTFLLANATISAAVAGVRIYPMVIPQKSEFKNGERAIVLSLVSSVRDGRQLRGPGNLQTDRYQVDVWALNKDPAKSIGHTIRQRIDGYAGTWRDGASPETVIAVKSIRFDSAQDIFEEDILGGAWRYSAEYLLTSALVGESVLI